MNIGDTLTRPLTAPSTIVAGELASVCNTHGLTGPRAARIVDRFAPLAVQIEALVRESEAINVTDASQTEAMELARRFRLDIRKLRGLVEEARVQEKDDALTLTKVIDGIARLVRTHAESAEYRLQAHEEFAARAKSKRLDTLENLRRTELTPLVANVAVFNLRDMSEEQYQQTLAGLKAAQRERAELLAKQRNDAEEREAQHRAEQEKLREENRKLDEQRRQADQAALEERRQREAIETKDRERQAQEERDKAEYERRERAATQAPDAEKIRVWARNLRNVAASAPVTTGGVNAFALLTEWRDKLADRADQMAATLEGGAR